MTTQPFRRALITLLILFAGSLAGFAQDKEPGSGNTNHDGYSLETKTSISLAENPVNIKVTQRFKNKFPGASETQWYKLDKGGFLVTFLQGTQKTQAVFSEAGNLSYSVEELKITDLPTELNNRIQSAYKGYQVKNIRKVNAYNTEFLLVLIENESNFIQLKWVEDDLEEAGRFKKAAE